MKQNEADVLILCGGLGTRLGDLSGDLPKPMVMIGDKPFLQLLVEQVLEQKFKRILLCAGHKGNRVRDYFQDFPGIDFSLEPAPLGTAGALKFAAPRVRSADMLILNGDSYCPLDFHGLLAYHREKEAVVSMAVVPAAGRRDAGFMSVSAEGEISEFREKEPAAGQTVFMNAGVYAAKREILDMIPPVKPCSLERDFFPRLAPSQFKAYITEAPVYDIGTPRRLEEFRSLYSQEKKIPRP
jgi:NDP-sugar pyrophosphorylase family protein